jgi:replicative DNA helicase
MSLGLQFIEAMVKEGNASPLQDASEMYFEQRERKAFNFVRMHHRRYGTLPDRRTIRSHGITLMRSMEPASYYLDRLRQRYVYNLLTKQHPSLANALNERDVDKAMNVLRGMATVAEQVASGKSFTTLAAEFSSIWDGYLEAKENGARLGIQSGWPTFDSATLGMQNGDLIVFLGRPKMGKTWMLVELINHVLDSGHSVLAMSMEMNNTQFSRRLLGRMSGLNPKMIRSASLSRWGEQKMLRTVRKAAKAAPLYLMSGDMDKNVETLDRLAAQYTPDLIAVDAAYLMNPYGEISRGYSKADRLSQVVKELKQLAIKHDRPVVITWQFNRERRANSKGKADTAQAAATDSIGQDASIIVGINQGPPPFEDAYRDMEFMKDREGEEPRFRTRFSFRPVDFSEVPIDEERTFSDQQEDEEWSV